MDTELDDMEMEVEPEVDMDVGESIPSSSDSSFAGAGKRLAVKNTIQTNFGEDYVFQIASSPEFSTLAVSLSTNTIKLYSPATGQFLGDCKGHHDTIHEISFSMPSSPHLLCSCSSDATVRTWDTRNFKQVSLIKAGSPQEIFSFCIGGSNNNLLAGGGKAQILFWDWRNGKQVACLEESHMEDVTQVRFTPNQLNKLISASVDGLLCLFDTNGHIDDDNSLESVPTGQTKTRHHGLLAPFPRVVLFCPPGKGTKKLFSHYLAAHSAGVMNVGTSIGKFGFFGEKNHKLWCLTHIETLSIWDWRDGRRDINFENAKTLASKKWNPGLIDYFVDCHYSETEDRLWVIGGTGAGTLVYFPVDLTDHSGAIGSPEAILEGAHTGVVRTVLPVSMPHLGIVPEKKGVFGWTGGEDGRLCCWSSDESVAANRSWITSTLVMKSPRARSKSRHLPY